MMIDEAVERAAFEAWAKEYGRIFLDKTPFETMKGERYTCAWTQEAWVGWQARAKLQKPALHEPVTDDELQNAMNAYCADEISTKHGWKVALESFLQGRAKPASVDWERVARAQNAKLRAMVGEPGGIERLRAVLAIAKPAQEEITDAERYRWIRELPNADSLNVRFCGSDLDNVVDAAIRASKGEK